MQETEKKTGRNLTIDLLRMIGLFLVISAHCNFPDWFYEPREFDVVTLVAVSGMSFYLSAGRTQESYGSYVIKRFRKLVLPVWVFLVFFFLFFRLLGRSFTVKEIAESFLLLSGGILFIWVYRIFFINALLNPFLKRLAEKYSFFGGISLLIIGLGVNELLFRLVGLVLTGTAGKVFDYVVVYTLGYALISWAGILWEKGNRTERMILLAAAAALFTLSVIAGGFRNFSESKYPPQLYYISYGLLVTFGLYMLCAALPLNKTAGQVITWLSVRTMRIYIWHIFLYYLLDTMAPSLMDHAWLTYGVLLGGGILGAYLQEKTMHIIKKR